MRAEPGRTIRLPAGLNCRCTQKAVPTIVGATGGAVAGHEVQKRQRGANETFRVSVRMDNGYFQTVTQDNITDLRSGDRVRVENGRLYRM